MPDTLAPGSLYLFPRPVAAGWTATGTLEAEHRLHPLTCKTSDLAPVYTYADGACTSADGTTGNNRWPIDLVRETRLGVCNDFGVTQLNENLLNGPQLQSWDLRGADLTQADLVFATLVDARLEGAQMDGMTYGHATIEGRIDSHTRPPDQGCDDRPEQLSCSL